MSEVSGVTEGSVNAIDILETFTEKTALDTAVEDAYPPPNEVYPTPNIESIEKTSSYDAQFKLFFTNGGSKKRYTHLLRVFFGEALVERVVNSDLYRGLPNSLEKKHCYELLGAVGHKLTYDDLENFFAEIKSGSIKTEILKYSHIPFLGRLSNTVDQLPKFWINHLIELFRNPLQVIDPNHELTLGAELEAANLHKKRSLSYTYYDYAIKQLMSEGNRSRPEFYLSHRELLAKFISYGDTFSTEEGMIIPVFNEQTGQLDYYQLESQVHLSGLHGYLLTPWKKNPEAPAILTFRGTDGGASKHRDLDHTGVGKQTYDVCAPEILKMLESYASRVKQPKLELVGHSLGAADCQRTLVNLLGSPLANRFSEIDLYSYCSPRLDAPTISKWNATLDKLALEEHKPVIRFSFAYHEKDIITWTGDSNLKGTENFFIERNYLIVKSDSGISDVMLHHTAPFFKHGNFDFETDNRSFQFVKSYSQNDLDMWVKKLEEIKNTSGWYLTLKSYFVKVETLEEIEQRIEQIKREQARFEDFKEKNAEQSWLVWSASRALNYTLQPIAYYTYGWLIGAGPKTTPDPKS